MSEIGVLLFVLRRMRAERINNALEIAAGTITPRTVTPPLSRASETSWINIQPENHTKT